MSENDIKQGQDYKNQGNQFFKQKNYEEAIKMYGLAIQKDPKQSIYYSNRSRCYFNLNNFQDSLKDAEKSASLDQKNIKAYYLIAESLVEIASNTKSTQKMQVAIEKLKKSLVLCPGQGKNQFESKFIDKIYLCKKRLWILNSEQQRQKKKKVRSYLINLVETDLKLTEYEKDQLNQRIMNLLDSTNQQNTSKIPQSLLCPINKMIMKDPVCNQFGNTYSKQAYYEEIKKNNYLDPLTKNKITKNWLYPNINIKKAIEDILEKYPWAYNQKIIV